MFTITLLRNNIGQQILIDESHPTPLYTLSKGMKGVHSVFHVAFESMKPLSS